MFGKVLFGVVAVAVIIIALLALGKAQDNAGKPAVSELSEITAEDHATGKLDSLVTLVEYSDFQCPACAQYAPLVEEVISNYSDKVRFVYRHYPIYSKHPNAENGGRAAEAAAKQGKFFEYGSVLFTNQTEWSVMDNPEDKLAEYAKSLGLNEEQFRKDYKDSASKDRVTKDYQSGLKAGVTGTPTFFLNGKAIGNNPQSYAAFAKLLDAELAKTTTPATDTIPVSP
jgi:protein-disulfide isomerase